MRTEFVKIRSLPTPRWTGLALLICFVLGLAGTIQWGIGEDNTSLEIAVNFPTWIAALVFGVWIAGVEFGQDTMRRALAADPRRLRLVFSKLAVLILVVAVVTAGLTAAGALLYDLAGSGHKYPIDFDLAVRSGAGSVVGNLIVAVIGMGLTLLTRSMAGGLTITLVFVFLLDTALAFIPKVGNYSLGMASNDLTIAISGAEGAFGDAANLDAGIAALTVAGWILVIFGAGILRTVKTDVK